MQHTFKELIKRIRNGLFLAPSRSYGEQYVEPFVRKKYDLKDPTGNDNDGTDQTGKRYEIKACKVLRATGYSKKLKTIIERILFENNNLETNRLVLFSESKTAEYLANVQNVKRDHFDYLIYVLLFADCVKIFFAKSEDIRTLKYRWDLQNRNSIIQIGSVRFSLVPMGYAPTVWISFGEWVLYRLQD